MTVASQGMTDAELALAKTFLEQIAFNKVLGLEPQLLSEERCEFSLTMKDELIGNWTQGILHGGVIASALDVAGGAMAMIAAWNRLGRQGVPTQDRPAKLTRLGTIDMRVDYLHPGKGKTFVANASLLRVGNKVAVTRMEFHNELGMLIAVGTGTYLCG